MIRALTLSRALLACLLLLWLAGCARTPSVVTDHDPEFAFGQLNSFRIEEAQPQEASSVLISPLTLAHLRKVITQRLGDRYELVEENADFLVRYHVVVENRIEERRFNDRYGFGYYRGPWFYQTHHHGSGSRDDYRQGTVIIDIAHADDNRPLWRGVAEQRLSDGQTPAERRTLLSAAITDILSRFPPVGDAAGNE